MRNYFNIQSLSEETRVLYHITGYKDSKQFEWLFRAIYNQCDLFIIHIDKKSSNIIHHEYKQIAEVNNNVVFLPSLPVTWGGCGLIDAEMLAIQYALEHKLSWTHLVNLSAQDYPLVTPAKVRECLAKSKQKNYVLCKKIGQEHWRIQKRPKFKHVDLKNRRIFTPIPKFIPRDIKVEWFGPWWHILTREFCAWLVSDDKALSYQRFFRDAGMPDETLVQNIIMDSPFRDNVVSCCKHEIIWRRQGDPRSSSAHPCILTIRDLSMLEASDAFFARKFDHGIDHLVLEALAKRNSFLYPVGCESRLTTEADSLA